MNETIIYYQGKIYIKRIFKTITGRYPPFYAIGIYRGYPGKGYKYTEYGA